VTRGGVVYELFFTNLPHQAFTACDVVELYLHRGAFESTEAYEDQEIDSDRWCSHARVGTRSMAMHCAMGLDPQAGTGASLASPESVRTTEAGSCTRPARSWAPTCTGLRGSRYWTCRGSAGRDSGQDFALQPDGTVLCPAHQKLLPHEHRREADGSLRVIYGASLRSCRPWPDATTSVNGKAPLPQSRSPRQRAVASAPGGRCPAPLALLPPESTSACLHAARAPPAPGDEPVATGRRFATRSVRDPVARTTRAVSSLLARAAGSQCSRFHRWASHDPGVRRPSSLCRLSGFGDRLTLS
jgi:hypothetical protein